MEEVTGLEWNHSPIDGEQALMQTEANVSQDSVPRRHARVRLLYSVVVGFGLIVATAACGGTTTTSPSATSPSATPTFQSAPSLTSIIAAAEKEKTVVWYSLGSSLSDPLVAGFEKAYPWATVSVINLTPGTELTRLLTEHKAGVTNADVVMIPASDRTTFLSNDLVQAVTLPNDSTMPTAYVDPTHYAHPVYNSPVTLVYNTKLLTASQVPHTLAALTNPEYKGKIAFDKPQNIAIAAFALGGEEAVLGSEAKWTAWLDGLKSNGVTITADASSGYQDVVQGSAALALDTPSDVLTQPAGTPVAIAEYSPIIPFTQYQWLTRGGPHPAMGELFINWVMSAAGQEVLASTGRSPALGTVNSKVSLSHVFPGATYLANSAMSSFFANPAAFLQPAYSLWPE